MTPLPPKPAGPAPVYQLKVGLKGAKPPIWRRLQVPADASLTRLHEKIVYTYDFGDDWRHETLLEKVLTPDPSVTYPRCTGGRRAAPPEDCGGIWSYQAMLEVLADPAHPDHTTSLEWLDVDNATEFDPATFDAATVTKALTEPH